MRRALVYFAFLFAWIAMVAAVLIAEEKFRTPPVERNNLSSLQQYLMDQLNEALDEKRLGCAGLAILHKGRVVHEQGFGIASKERNEQVDTRKTLFLLSSLSKAVTAWGVMKLVEEKRLTLDEPVIKHLKRWRFPGSEQYSNLVTARQLLNHTAGFVDGYGHSGFLPHQKKQTIEEALSMPADANTGEARPAIMVNKPGTVMSYSSAGYAVLQLLIEDITGKAFDVYMNEAILRPLGMQESSFNLDSIMAGGAGKNLADNYDLDLEPHPHRYHSNMAGVSLRSTLHDLTKLALAYSNGNPVLSANSIRQFRTPQPGTNGTWGLGHTLYAANDSGGYIFGHGGGAFPASGAEMRLNPATGDGIIIVATGTQGLISGLCDTWTYWETGEKVFDIRKLISNRLPHFIIATVIGGILIFMLLKKKWQRIK